jgi:hypothetical protein
MTAFSINQTLISTWRMTLHGRDLSIALQHICTARRTSPKRSEWQKTTHCCRSAFLLSFRPSAR